MNKQFHLALFIIWFGYTAASNTYYISPNSCNTCHTLNEILQHDIALFSDDTTLVLYPGLHIINSTKHICVIKNIGSFMLIGQPGATTVKCLHEFGFRFVDIKDITLHHIKFKSCSLLTELDIKEVIIKRATRMNNTFLIFNVQNINVNNLNIVEGGVAVVPTNISNATYRFQDISITSGQIGIYVIKQVGYGMPEGNLSIYVHNTIFIDAFMDVITTKLCPGINVLEMRSVAYYNRTKTCCPVLYVVNVCQVYFISITFKNNSSPLMDIIGPINTTVFSGYCSFVFNSGKRGILLRTTNILLRFTKFDMRNNTIQKCLFCIFSQGKNSTALWSGTKISIQNNTILSGSVMEINYVNSFSIEASSLLFKSNSGLFTRSTAIWLLKDIVNFFLSKSSVTFSYNKAGLSGGITFVKTRMILLSHIQADFNNNEGGNGAAMAFYQESVIIILTSLSSKYVNVHYHNNNAMKLGGAIFVEDSDYMDIFTKKLGPFFVKLPEEGMSSSLQFHFSNNSAEMAGNDVYGGWIDLCRFSLITNFTDNNNYNSITSNPIRICMCINSVPNCSVIDYRVMLFPGQTIEIEAVAVGQKMGIVPSIVLAQFTGDESSLGEGQSVQNVGRGCSKLQFAIYTAYNLQEPKELLLRAQDIGVPKISRSQLRLMNNKYLSQQFSIVIEVQNCKAGFEFQASSKKCICSPLIMQHHGVSCNLNTFLIQRSVGKWLSITNEHNNVASNTGMIFHDNCPHDYCRSDTNSLRFDLDRPDDQCAFNRSGVLCGACQANLSGVLGTSKCRECSSLMLFAIISAANIAGILLVALIMILNITVAMGTVSGLIFYANIIQASHAVFFPMEITSSFLSVFIAWVNLDLGIETCFYDGLDAYAKTWLQFVFPFYIWIIVITIIVASHYSSIASKFFGNNAVHVLATLFLLSYAKILRVVITVFSSTVLIYPDGYEKRVWLLDGNIEFLCGKHIPLFVASLLVFVLLSVPYTLSLVSIQWLQRISHYRALCWVHKLMPLFDAYTGPYKHMHRYWTGLLLLIRTLFILIFSLNISNNPAVNLLAIAVISFTLLGYLCFMRVYKKFIHNILEAVSIFNLGQLSVATLYQISSGASRVTVTRISTSIAFIIVVCIMSYHGIQRLLSLNKVKYITTLSQRKMKEFALNKRDIAEECINTKHINLNSEATHSSVKLSELPLLPQENNNA